MPRPARRRPTPVSYTHLDVYKRQVLALRGSGMLAGPLPTDSGAVGDVVVWAVAGALLAGVQPAIWLRSRVRERQRRIEQGLPFVLDLMTLCVEAGLSTVSYTHLDVYKRQRQ